MLHLEVLESRQLLTNLVAVQVHGNDLQLNDASRGHVSHGDDFTVAYTATQAVLTGQNGTQFKVGNQTLSTYTVDLTAPASIKMHLNAKGNSVTVSGDGSASLSALTVDLGPGRQNNSLSLAKVIANSVAVNGGRNADHVVISQSTINADLVVRLGNSANDVLDLESSTVNGNVRDQVGQLILNHSTIKGRLDDVELGANRIATSTDTTFGGPVSIRMGNNGAVNLLASSDGPNHTKSTVTITGNRRHPITINQHGGVAATFDVAPTLHHATINVSAAPITAPTVVALTTVDTTPTITGTFDSVNGPLLKVAVNNKTYTLGTDAQLTSPSAGKWSLNLTGAALPTGGNTVTVTSSNSTGDSAQGTGTVTIPVPTVTSLSSVKNTPTISGTYDAVDAPNLKVSVNNKTYTLGTDAQLTSPSAGHWSLDLTGAPLPAGTTTVTATNSDSSGNSTQGTGTVITNDRVDAELSTIHTYESTNSLTAHETNSGLNYVITTNGTGSVPTAGQKVTVNYTGHILNADGTLGAEFDSNVDSQFNHVTPFQFTLGNGSVIAGWDEAFALLPVGTVAKLIIPSPLGYGATGSGSSIPANSILVFDVTLISVS